MRKFIHPFRREPDASHVASREENKSTENKNELGDQFRWGPVWHMDLVGSKRTRVPNVVSALQFLDLCQYTMLPPDLKQKWMG
jgi:hypothetical protein